MSIEHYPISLDEIRAKVAKKNNRRNKIIRYKESQIPLFNHIKLDNIKEITNEFGEKITRVDGDIPIDLR